MNIKLNKLKRNLSSNHRAYFTYSNDNKIQNYKYEICIDMVHLKAYLTPAQIEEIKNQFSYKSIRLAEGIYSYIIDLVKEMGVHITLNPHNKLNAKLQLHPKFTNGRNNNKIILQILNDYQWYIRRLDVATTYTTPFHLSAALKRHGLQRQENYKTGQIYGNTNNQNAKAHECHYDRYERDNTLDTEYINRFEVRIMFQIKDRMTFAKLNHSVIAKRLRKELFIPHTFFSTLTKDELKVVRESAKVKNENYLKEALTKKQYEELRKHFKESRDNLEDYYLNNSHLIYDFLLGLS